MQLFPEGIVHGIDEVEANVPTEELLTGLDARQGLYGGRDGCSVGRREDKETGAKGPEVYVEDVAKAKVVLYLSQYRRDESITGELGLVDPEQLEMAPEEGVGRFRLMKMVLLAGLC